MREFIFGMGILATIWIALCIVVLLVNFMMEVAFALLDIAGELWLKIRGRR